MAWFPQLSIHRRTAEKGCGILLRSCNVEYSGLLRPRPIRRERGGIAGEERTGKSPVRLLGAIVFSHETPGFAESLTTCALARSSLRLPTSSNHIPSGRGRTESSGWHGNSSCRCENSRNQY